MLKPQSRASEAASVLRTEALTRGPGSRLSSVRELISKLGFSQASLSAALAQLELEGVVVRRHGSGIYAASSPPSCHLAVAIASPFLLRANQSPFWTLVLNRILTGVAERGWECTCHVGTITERGGWPSRGEKLELSSSLLNEMSRGGAAGLISLGLTKPEVLAAGQAGKTVVSFAGYGHIMLATDLALAAEQGIRSMIGVGKGLIKVAPCERYSLPMALKGIAAAQVENVQPVAFFDESRQALTDFNEEDDEIDDLVSAGRNWMTSMAQQTPFRLVSLDDMFTKGALQVMTEKGLLLGKDVTVATHSNRQSPVLAGWEDCLFRMEIDPEAVALELLDLMAAASRLGGWDRVAKEFKPAQVLPGGELVYQTYPKLILPSKQP